MADPAGGIVTPPTAAAAPPAGLTNVGWDVVIDKIAKQHGVNPALARALAMKESSMTPGVTGDGGQAIGMFQLHEDAAYDMGMTPEDRKDPIKNITGGVKYLRTLTDRYNGDVTKALQAYNGGSKYVDAGQVSPEAQAYASEVLANLSGNVRQAATTPANRGGGRGTSATVIDPAHVAANAKSMGHELVHAYDPRTPEGRENVAAGVGSLGTAYLTSGLPVGGIVAKLATVLGPAIGAAAGAGTEVGVERALGTTTASPIKEAGYQGAIDLAGQAFMWPIRAVFRRGIAPTIADNAATGLKAEAVSVRDQGHAAVAQVRSNVADAVNLVKQTYASVIDKMSGEASGTVRMAQRRAGEMLADTELKNGAELAGAKKMLDDLAAQPPSVIGTASTVKAAVQGPVQKALDIAGQQVRGAADQLTQQGVTIDLKPLQAKIAEMAEATRPATLFGQAPKAAANAIGFGNPAADALKQKMVAAATAKGAAQATAIEDANAAVAHLFGIKPEQMNPALPGAVGKILTADGPISFTEAHQIKTILDESVNWDRTAKKNIERLTKGARSTLRDLMAGHAPYDDATATYAALVPLYRKGVGKQLITLSQTPAGSSKVGSLLKENDPISARTVRELLVNQAAAGGDAQLGHDAWTAVRAAYTYDNLITGGIDKLASNLDTLATQHPEFVREVYGDMTGRQVLTNLGTIAEAFTKADAEATARLAATKSIGKAGVQDARDVAAGALTAVERAKEQEIATTAAKGRQQVASATTAARTAREQQAAKAARFAKSSVGKFTGRGLEDEGADAAKALLLGPTSKWGALSLFRLLRGAKSADLIEWAAYSAANTQRLVNLLTKPGPPEAMAALIRDAAMATRQVTGNGPQQAAPTK